MLSNAFSFMFYVKTFVLKYNKVRKNLSLKKLIHYTLIILYIYVYIVYICIYLSIYLSIYIYIYIYTIGERERERERERESEERERERERGEILNFWFCWLYWQYNIVWINICHKISLLLFILLLLFFK